MSIVDVLEEAIFELGIEISVSDATNLIRLVEEKLTAHNTKSMSLQLAEQSYKCAVCGCSEFDLK